MLWPPPLYWAFVWTRSMSLQGAALAWAAVVFMGVLIATLAWIPAIRRDLAAIAVTVLLLFQFPVLFAVERGNNDVLVLVLWTIAALSFARGHFGWSGLSAGIAVALKLYPAFAVGVVGLGLIWWAWWHPTARRFLLLFTVGGVAGVAISVLPLIDQWIPYLQDEFQQRRGFLDEPPVVYEHGLRRVASGSSFWLMSAAMLLVWVIASVARLRREPMLIFAGALAISTYFIPSSWDYNLITVYPLLLLLFVRVETARWRPIAFGLLMLGLVAVVGNREWFAPSVSLTNLHTVLQWWWLVLTGLAVAIGRLDEIPRGGTTAEPLTTPGDEPLPSAVQE